MGQGRGHIFLQLLRIIDCRFQAGERIKKLPLHGRDAPAELAFKLGKGALCAPLRTRVDQIHHGFSLCKVELARKERALGEFARPRAAGMAAQQRQHPPHRSLPPMKVKLRMSSPV